MMSSVRVAAVHRDSTDKQERATEMEDFPQLEGRLAEHHIPAMEWGQIFHDFDPGMYQAYVEWTVRARQHVALEPKIREMVAIVVNCVVAWPSPYADVHYHRALEEGATVQELADVVLATGRLAGPHAYTHGLNLLAKVLADRAKDGRPSRRGRAEDPDAHADETSLDRGQ
jgi:alkylhydroperoxidase/carboxymuconolactone decarboxylase family protein YurZ